MKAKLHEDGGILLTAETEFESHSLSHWWERYTSGRTWSEGEVYIAVDATSYRDKPENSLSGEELCK